MRFVDRRGPLVDSIRPLAAHNHYGTDSVRLAACSANPFAPTKRVDKPAASAARSNAQARLRCSSLAIIR